PRHWTIPLTTGARWRGWTLARADCHPRNGDSHGDTCAQNIGREVYRRVHDEAAVVNHCDESGDRFARKPSDRAPGLDRSDLDAAAYVRGEAAGLWVWAGEPLA